MNFNSWCREHEIKFTDYSAWKNGCTFHRNSATDGKHIATVYDKCGNINAFIQFMPKDYKATELNNHTKLTFNQFKSISAVCPERWIVINKDTVAILAEKRNFVHKKDYNHFTNTYTTSPFLKQINDTDIVFCYDIIGFNASKKLWQFEKQRFEAALTLNNNKRPEAALDYLIQVSQSAINKEQKKLKEQMAKAEEEYKKIVERLKQTP